MSELATHRVPVIRYWLDRAFVRWTNFMYPRGRFFIAWGWLFWVYLGWLGFKFLLWASVTAVMTVLAVLTATFDLVSYPIRSRRV